MFTFVAIAGTVAEDWAPDWGLPEANEPRWRDRCRMATATTDHARIAPAEDRAIDRRSRAFLREINKDPSPFWELPGDEPRRIVTALQEQTPVDLSGIEVEERGLDVD